MSWAVPVAPPAARLRRQHPGKRRAHIPYRVHQQTLPVRKRVDAVRTLHVLVERFQAHRDERDAEDGVGVHLWPPAVVLDPPGPLVRPVELSVVPLRRHSAESLHARPLGVDNPGRDAVAFSSCQFEVRLAGRLGTPPGAPARQMAAGNDGAGATPGGGTMFAPKVFTCMLEQARCAPQPTLRPSPARLARPRRVPTMCPRLSHSPSLSPFPALPAQEAPRRRRRRVRARVSLPEPPALAAVHPRVGPGRRRVDRRSRGRRRRASSMRRPGRARRRHRPAAANRHAALVPLRQHEGPVHAADAGRRGLRGVRRVPRAERGGGTRRRDEFRRGRSGGYKRRAATTTTHPPVHPRRGEGARP